ncbi:MAG: FYVE zinc finger domain-containing protein [Treponema sp.]|nr:FYVE zinc finger domain-containing protein [Treponema sp.]
MDTLRTLDELDNPDFNYYFAFGIDPAEKDTKKIETAMATRKNNWTQGTVVQRRLKDLYTEAVKIMTDKALRDEEFQAAKKFRLEEAKKTIELIAKGRGTIYKSDFKKTVEKIGKWVTADEIEKESQYLLGQGVKIIDDTSKTLDFLTYDKIDKLLRTAGKNDLYDLLGQDPLKANVSSLQSAITAAYASISGKTDPKSTATNQVCGEAKKVFKDDNSKKYYDIYLKTKDIWEEFALRSKNYPEMEEDDFINYSERVKTALNIKDADFVETLLAEGLQTFRITLAGGDKRRMNLENCPNCNKSYNASSNTKSCPHCHTSLEIVCWNCGGKAPYTEKNKTCPACLATKDHSTRFDTIVKKIDTLLVQPGISITDIQTELNNLKNILPDYSKVSSSKIAKKVTEYQDKVNKKVKEEETVGTAYKEEYEKIQELVNLKKFFTASGAVTTLKNKYPTYNAVKTDALAASINSIVARVKQYAEKAKTLSAQNNEEAAVSEIASALDLASDYIEAKQILSKFPPKVPESVTAAIKDNAALISWNQSKVQKLVAYTIIRKTGSKPTSAEDGTVVASGLSINFFEDKTIVSDTPYFYAVFSSRLGINSAIVCSASQIITYFDVSNIRQEVVSGKIVVRWETPLNVGEVEVIKKKGLTPPSGNTDGQKISVKGNESFEDSDYDKAGNSYLFVCIYKNSKGTTRSKGVTRTFKAFEELKPLTNIKIEQNGTTSFTFTCDKTISGKREIYFSPQEIHCEFGKTLQVAEFKNFNKGVNTANLLVSDDNTASFNLPPDKLYYVYPVVCNEQLLIVSKPFVVNTMIGVSKISFSETSDEAVITGQPHVCAKNIVAKISDKAFPVNLSSDGYKIAVTKEDFVKNGLHVKLKSNTDSYITIFAETDNEGVVTVTCGVPLSSVITLREKATVQYTIKYTVTAGKSFPIKIDFKSDKPAVIPELMLVKGNPRPMSKNDGQLVERTPVITLKKGLLSGGGFTASVTIKSDSVPVSTKFAVFPSVDNNIITLKEVKNL